MNWIYIKTSDDKYRYALGEVSEQPTKILFCFGINPSTATPQKLDPTAMRIKQIAKAHGYDSWIILNVCAERSTNPNKISTIQDTNLQQENLKTISNLLEKYNECSDILFAYGNLINKRPYLRKNLCEIVSVIKAKKYKGCCYCLGKTKDGNAKHPLYQKIDTTFVPYSLENHTYSELFTVDDKICVIRVCSAEGDLIREVWGINS